MKLKKPLELSEHRQQCHIFQFAEIMQVQYPELRLLSGSLNGVRLTIGQAIKAKRTPAERTSAKNRSVEIYAPEKRYN